MGLYGLDESDFRAAKRLHELEKSNVNQERYIINLESSGWNSPEDFYREFLKSIKAPEWHGHDLDALWDSLSGMDINKINPPFTLVLSNTEILTADMQVFISRIVELFGHLKSEDVDVDLIRIKKDEESE